MSANISLRLAMRKLWSDHVFRTREYVIAPIVETANSNEAAARLLRNQEDIGNAIVPFCARALSFLAGSFVYMGAVSLLRAHACS